MKRRELIARLQQMGCVLIRHGGRHDWYQNPKTGESQPVPRHVEIKEPGSIMKPENGLTCAAVPPVSGSAGSSGGHSLLLMRPAGAVR